MKVPVRIDKAFDKKRFLERLAERARAKAEALVCTPAVTREAYVASPCSLLPAPYAVCGGRAEDARHIAGEGITPPSPMPQGAYCRLYRRLGDMERITSERYSVRQLFLDEDPDDMTLCAELAPEKAEHLHALIKTPYYSQRLCVAVHDRSDGSCVCAGLACCAEDGSEAWIDEILPSSADGEALSLLINELLRRMAVCAPFATACAEYGSVLERELRKRGFTGGDVWVRNL